MPEIERDMYWWEKYVSPIDKEERQKTFCSSCNKITYSSKADYQSEFTCNDCGAEVQEEE